MAINLQELSKATTTANGLSNLILVTPRKSNEYKAQSPNGGTGKSFVFHNEGENTASLDSDITEHYVENNTTISDHIALRSEVITVSGFIGELNDFVPAYERELNLLKEKLMVISPYTPELTITALNAYNTAFQAYQLLLSIARSAGSAWETVNGDSKDSIIGSEGLKEAKSQNKQQIAFQQLYAQWRSRTLFTVQTPWAVFQNMAIKSIRAIQSSETSMVTDFEIMFKMIRYAEIERIPSAESLLQKQASDVKNMGSQKGIQANPAIDGLANDVLSAITGAV